MAEEPTLLQQLAEARINERKRCALVILQHRTEIDVGTSYSRMMNWLEQDTAADTNAAPDVAEVNQAAADIDVGEVEDGDIAEDPDADRAAAMELTSGLVDLLVDVVAEGRRLREENQVLRGQMASEREHAELKVTRAGDFLRTALGIIETGEEQYRAPEAPEAAASNG
jgi:hypothetical protein